MERRVKERLIGASILVIAAVLLVPELLSGPRPAAPLAPKLPAPASAHAPEPMRNVTVDLATSKPAAPEPADTSVPASAATESHPNEASSAEPEPGASTAEPSATAAPSSARTDKPSPKYPVPQGTRLPVDSSAPPPTSAWSVQLGSFASRGNADGLVQKLKAQGFGAYVSATGSGKSQRFRARVGPLGDRSAADHMVKTLKGAGHDGSVVAPGH